MTEEELKELEKYCVVREAKSGIYLTPNIVLALIAEIRRLREERKLDERLTAGQLIEKARAEERAFACKVVGPALMKLFVEVGRPTIGQCQRVVEGAIRACGKEQG